MFNSAMENNKKLGRPAGSNTGKLVIPKSIALYQSHWEKLERIKSPSLSRNAYLRLVVDELKEPNQ